MPDYVGCIARRDLKTRGKLPVCTAVNTKVQFIGDARMRDFKDEVKKLSSRWRDLYLLDITS